MCGIFGIAYDGNCLDKVGRGLFHLQHRGQKSVGLAFSCNGKPVQNSVLPGLVRPNDSIFQLSEGEQAIGHVSLKEPQPFFAHTKMGEIAMSFSGNIRNSQEIRENFLKIGCAFTSHTDVELIARLIGQHEDPVEGIKGMAERIRGAFSLVLITEKGVYAARDPFGFRPLIIGKDIRGCAVASESPPLVENEMKIIRDVRPGEIILIEKQGFTTVGLIPSPRSAHCAFEWAYIARYDSVIDGVPVYEARHNLGAALARNDNIEVDLVSPVPMSGTGHAVGYHQASGIPYGYVFFYNRYSDRSYTPLDQKDRDRIAAEKLSLIEGMAQGKRIALLDDSIVRGTQMRRQVARLREAGAKEIHIRVASPPLVAPCAYGISTRTYKELIARNHPVEEIRKLLGADTLRYNSVDEFVSAIGIPAEKLCLSCWTDEYPV
ncbi:MAG: amidophosphoribosyltransferase [Candidatus Moranbacteria bacterium]|nr:amidophosphoribosyltransferase [Candidatus Moranbacteria bacterium]